MIRTVLCELLGIRYPIIQGAMGGAGGPRLAAAVSQAGGLGVLTTFGNTAEKLRQSIRETRRLTDRPFAVNIVPLGPAFTRACADVIIEEGVRIATTGRGDPTVPIVQMLKEQGVKVLPVVPTVRLARRLEEEGADAIIASGTEAGGHVGKVATLPLLPQVVDAVKVPVVAAGGFADGRGLVAALALGACGIQMGTRFIGTPESDATAAQKEAVLRMTEEQTAVSALFTGKPVRMTGLDDLAPWLDRERRAAGPQEVIALANELRKEMRRSLGRAPAARMAAGQVGGMVCQIKPAAAIIEEVMAEASAILRRLAALDVAEGRPLAFGRP